MMPHWRQWAQNRGGTGAFLHTEKNRVLILTENTLLLGDAALTEVSDREESGIQQMAPWQNGYYCVTEEGLTHRRL